LREDPVQICESARDDVSASIGLAGTPERRIVIEDKKRHRG
jgi:hypothetical protein